jgi:hypothetical protein
MPASDNAPEIGRDALDPLAPPPRWLPRFPQRHAALGLRPTAAPLLGFVLCGIALGPSGLGVLDAPALAHLDIVVSVALAALGVFVGLGLGAMRAKEMAPLGLAALVQVATTIAVVGFGLLALLERWQIQLPLDTALIAVALAISAAASAAIRAAHAPDDLRLAARLVDLDDVPLILLGALTVTYAAGRPIAMTVAVTVVAAVLTGLAGTLLFERARNDAERAVFVTGAVLLLGGVAAFTNTTPLLSGCVAALVWQRTAGAADRIIADDLRRLQHPLVALLLIVAGALVEWSLALLWIAAPLVLLRLIGKLAGGAAAARVTGVPPALLGTVLIAPGVLGIALALNLWQVLGERALLLVAAVTVATMVSELVAALLPAEAAAR